MSKPIDIELQKLLRAETSKGDYVEVPVLREFSVPTSENIIGTLKLLKSALPENPDWCISLGTELPL